MGEMYPSEGEWIMRHVIAQELRSSIWNLRFLCGAALILTTAFVIGNPYVNHILNTGSPAEGPGWLAAYYYSITAANALLFIPIAAPFAAGENAETELHSRFVLFTYSRSGKKPFFIARITGLIVSGGLMSCLAMGVLLAILCIRLGKIPLYSDTPPELTDIVLTLLFSFLRGFLNGALWALVGGLAAVVTRSRYLAYAVPFILYYVLTAFQERYYRKLFFLSPRYWAAPVRYGNLFCIAVLSILCILVSLLFVTALKRRLSYA